MQDIKIKPWEELKQIHKLSNSAFESGLEVHFGHGLDFETTKKLIQVKYLQEVNIGFFLNVLWRLEICQLWIWDPVSHLKYKYNDHVFFLNF